MDDMKELREALTVDEIERHIINTESIDEKVWTRRAAVSVHKALSAALSRAPAERTVAPAEPVAADEIKTESMGEFLLAAFLTYLADGNTIMSSAALALDKHEQAYEPADPLPSAPMQEDAGR